MLIDELRHLFNGKRRRRNNPKWNKYSLTGINFIKEINNLNPNLVLDLGCGQNPYKGHINNLIGVDTEFYRVSTYDPKLCLLQFSNRSQIMIVDPLNKKIDLELKFV